MSKAARETSESALTLIHVSVAFSWSVRISALIFGVENLMALRPMKLVPTSLTFVSRPRWMPRGSMREISGFAPTGLIFSILAFGFLAALEIKVANTRDTNKKRKVVRILFSFGVEFQATER